MKILFFAQSRVATGCAVYRLDVSEPLSQAEFWLRLTAIFPGLAGSDKSARLARNEVYLNDSDTLQPGDEIAVIPPVSGG